MQVLVRLFQEVHLLTDSRRMLAEGGRGNCTAFKRSLRAVEQVMRVLQPKRALMRILLADDDELIREIVAEGLRLHAYEVEAVSDGAAALAAVRRHRPGLILLDAKMPTLDGFAVLAALKADPALNHVPVIMLTALRNARDVIEARRLGASDYLAKPFDILNVLQRVRLWTGKRAGVGQTLAGAETSLVFGETRPEEAHWLE